MSDKPLQPFSPPASLAHYLPDGLSAGMLMDWFLYAVFVFWAIYTIVAIYHWVKYSHASWVAFPAIATHLVISIVLILYTLTGTPIV